MTDDIMFTLDTSYGDALQVQIENKLNVDNLYSARRDYLMKCDADDILDYFINKFPNSMYRIVRGYTCLFFTQNPDVLIVFYGIFNKPSKIINDSYDDSMLFVGERNAVKSIMSQFDKDFENYLIPSNSSVRMIIKSQTGLDSISLPIKTDRKFYPEIYPCIEDPKKFIRDFLNSSANVLILTGPAGLGKSALINQIILESDMPSQIVFDQEVMMADQLYTDFINKSLREGGGIMIMEDSDILLQDRIISQNTNMSRLLNLSDGIVNTSGSKFIFSANLADKSQIDSALTRPGRCFDIVEFRNLTRKEAQIAADAIGIDLYTEKSEYTVAEIFNNTSNRSVKRKVGFI